MKSVLIMLVALSPTLALANAKTDLAKIDASMNACLNSEDGQSNMGMKECTGNAYDAADKLLNRNYAGIVATLKKRTGDKMSDDNNAEILKRLQVSERAWVAYRDAQANLDATEMLGGSGESLVYLSSQYDLTKERVLKLDSLLSNTN